MHKDLAKMYNKSALLGIAEAAKLHANLISKYGEDKRYAKVFGDLYLSINAVLSLIGADE